VTIAEVLAAAIRDFTEHGFDSERRLNDWLAQLRAAIEANVRSPPAMEAAMRDALGAIYRRLVDKGQVLRAHPTVERFTVARVAPRLRLELERRIMASAQLIKLNRAEAIEKTVRRFSGWATSVPKGGSETVSRREVKDEVYKPLASLPFVERRVLIDQGHKLNSSISAVIAQDNNAIAAQWYSRWRVAGYNYRPDHKERDGLIYLIRDSWAAKARLVKPGPAGWSDEITQPAEEPFCFPASVKIPFVRGIEKAFRHWYSGELAEIVTSSGKTLRVTPNHPVLTTAGWRPAGLLNEGDNIVEISKEVAGFTEFYLNDRVPEISEIFGALDVDGLRVTQVGSTANFHGDGSDGNVDIVFSTRSLLSDAEVQFTEPISKFIFSVAVHCGRFARSLDLCLRTGLCATHCGVSGLCKAFSAFWPLALHPESIGLAAATQGYAGAREPGLNRTASDLEPSANHVRTVSRSIESNDFVNWDISCLSPADVLAGHVGRNSVILGDGVKLTDINSETLGALPHRFVRGTELSKVVKIDRRRFSGHVYNLQTKNGWYAAEGIVVHNCRCRYNYLYHLRQLPDDMLTAKGRAALAAARAA